MVSKLDWKILALLDKDARMAAAAIGRETHVAKERVLYHIRQLVQRGHIKGFHTILNLTGLGYQYYTLYLKLRRTTPETDKEFTAFLQQEPLCAEYLLCEGAQNCIIHLLAPDNEAVQAFLFRLRERFGSSQLTKQLHTRIATTLVSQQYLHHTMHDRKRMVDQQGARRELSDEEWTLLVLLASDARASLTALGKRIGRTARTVLNRMRALTESGIIVAYTVEPNLERIGKRQVQLCTSLRNDRRAAITEFFDRTGACMRVTEFLGEYDLAVDLCVSDEQQLREIIDAFRERHIGDYDYYTVLTIHNRHTVGWSPRKD